MTVQYCYLLYGLSKSKERPAFQGFGGSLLSF